MGDKEVIMFFMEELEEHDKKVREVAIDEFVKAIKSRLLHFVPTEFEDVEYIAKQLKEKTDE